MIGQIGKYTVERELGQGGFGKVYLAFDPGVGQPVAIKKLRAEGDPDLLKRFHMEIRVTASLRHKNIVTIHASGEEAGDPYLVMEFLEGNTLKQVIEKRMPLSLLEKVRIMSQVAEGLAYAHSKGVVHRDVKPENIMLLPDDNVKIMDFGIALGPNRHTEFTQTGGIIGTPPYFAPEQLEGYKANEQTDIFSFGDVYYELVTGVHPFAQSKTDWRALQVAIMSYEPRAVSELAPGCPEALETLIHRTLAKEPEFRYQTFEEVRLDSEAILVDLKHEGAAVILREVSLLVESGDLQTARTKIQQAYQLEPGNREVRRLREDINLRIQRAEVQTRVADLMTEAQTQMSDRRYAEAVQTLELAFRLDSSNAIAGALLEDARQRLDAFIRSNRLVSEARFHQQKGFLTEAQERLQEALALDPEHTDARRLSKRVVDEIERRRLEERCQQAIRGAQAYLADKRFAEALAVLGEIEKELPGHAGVADLRAQILIEEELEIRRLRAHEFDLELARARAAIQAGDLEHADQMVDRLYANFASEPGAAEALGELRERLVGLFRAREIASYQERARSLIQEELSRDAMDLLGEALQKFPNDPGLERLRKAAEDLYRVRQRAEAITAIVKDATAKRVGGDLQGALDTILKGRQELGDEVAFVELARQLETDIELQRYSSGLESLLRDGRELIAAGNYSAAIERLESARSYSEESGVRSLLDSARAAAAIEEERSFVEETLAAVEKLEGKAAWSQGQAAVARALTRYPQNSRLADAKDRLAGRVEEEQRQAAIERYRGVIRLELQRGQLKAAEAALGEARANFPGDRSFDDLAKELEAAVYEAGWREVEERVKKNLAATAVFQAESSLSDQKTRTLYAQDPRWKALSQEVAKRRGYEDALVEADRRQNEGRLSEAEELLTKVIDQGPPDKRAQQMRGAIQSRKSEAVRQQEITRIAQGIGELLKQGDLVQAASQLAAARSRYPGEGAWTDLQAGLDARQHSARRQTDIAAAAANVRQLLSRDEVRQARAALNAASAKFAGEDIWTTLEEEVSTREAIARQRSQIDAIAASVRQRLNSDHSREVRDAGSIVAMRVALLDLRREDLLTATAEVDAARAKYAGEELWDKLRAEIDARRRFLANEDEIADRLEQYLERGELQQAESELAAARAKFPDEDFWSMFQAEISRYRDELKLREEVARIAESVRERLKQDDPQKARKELEAARARYPRETTWTVLQSEIDLQEPAILRRKEIAAITASIRACVVRDDLPKATKELRTARAKYPEEPAWLTLDAEIGARQTELKHQAEISAIAKSIRQRIGGDDLERAASELRSALSKYPDAAVWRELQAEIDARRKSIAHEREVAAVAEDVRGKIGRDELDRASDALRVATASHPNEGLWAVLRAELDMRRAALARQADITAIAERVRSCIQREDLKGAGSELRAARTKYADEPLWKTLQDEADACRAKLDERQRRIEQERQAQRSAAIEAALGQARKAISAGLLEEAIGILRQAKAQYPEDQRTAELLGPTEEALRKREARARDLARLLEIEREVPSVRGKRQLQKLQKESQGIALRHVSDTELEEAAGRTRSSIEAALAGPEVKTPIPWKLVAVSASAAVAVIGAIVILPHLFRSGSPPAPTVVAVEIRTDPPGAAVTVGGRSCVSPDCRIDLKPGPYQLQAQRDGYVTAQETIEIAANKNPYVVDVTLKPVPPPPPPPGVSTGTLIVHAGQARARVLVDGSAAGLTDANGTFTTSLEAKVHEIRVEKERYQPASQQVTIVADAKQPVTFNLIQKDARLQLTGAPAGVEIRVGQKLLGRTNGTPEYLFPQTVTPGLQTLVVNDGSSTRQVDHRFEPDSLERLAWKDIAPVKVPAPPTAEELETRAWNQIQNTSDPGAVRLFLGAYRNGAHASQAQEKLEGLEWARTDRSSLEALEAFRKAFPNGPHAKQADSEIATLRDARAKAAAPPKGPEPKTLPKGPEPKTGGNNPPAGGVITEQQRQRAADQAAVQTTLERYKEAYAKKSTNELKSVWPTIKDQTLNNIKQAFSYVSKFSVELQCPSLPDIVGDSATIRCSRTMNQDRDQRTDTVRFGFKRAGQIWQIVSIE